MLLAPARELNKNTTPERIRRTAGYNGLEENTNIEQH